MKEQFKGSSELLLETKSSSQRVTISWKAARGFLSSSCLSQGFLASWIRVWV
jgi:hypothetical protein